MVLLRPLTGRLGMRRKSEWLGGVDVTRGLGGPVRGALHQDALCGAPYPEWRL